MKKFISAVSAAALAMSAMTSAAPIISSADNAVKPLNAPSYSNSADFIYYDTFESGEGSWGGRGAASTEVSSAQAYAGSKSLSVTGRSDNWNGATKSLSTSDFVPGTAYSFSVNVFTASTSKETTYHLTLQYNDASGTTNYDKIASGATYGGDWFQLANKSYTIPSGADEMSIYVETETGTANFFIDDAIAAPDGTSIEGAGASGTYLLGDVNCDGVINTFDSIAARKGFVNGFRSELAKRNCDVDCDTEVTEDDLKNIQDYIMGRITEFPYVGPPTPPPSDFDYDPAVQFRRAPDYYFGTSSKAGKIVKETYNGINGQKSLYVYLPYEYDENKKYNILYLMHGGGENENTIFFNANNDTQLGNMFDHMIENGELEPLIVVTPTFNGGNGSAQTFYQEFRQNVVPLVEGKYSTYAEDTTAAGITASRMHRAYGGFSMGAVSTWAVMQNCLDMVGYYMPLSGDHWDGNSEYDKANSIKRAIDKSGYSPREYFIFAATGDTDIAYPNISPQINAMKTMTDYFTYTSDFSKGNLYFMVGGTNLDHWWGNVRHYVYVGLPYLFHEGQ